MKHFFITNSVNVCSLADFIYYYIFLMFDWSEGIVPDWGLVFINVY